MPTVTYYRCQLLLNCLLPNRIPQGVLSARPPLHMLTGLFFGVASLRFPLLAAAWVVILSFIVLISVGNLLLFQVRCARLSVVPCETKCCSKCDQVLFQV